jgi:diguanylate cyclase (GGDEF)-like protein
MKSERLRWGFPVFLTAVVFITGVQLAVRFRPPAAGSALLERYIPAAGAVFSIICFFAGQRTYPRVNNPRVYLLGSLIGFSGLIFIAYRLIPGDLSAQSTVLYLAVFFNVLVVMAAPSRAKRQSTHRLTAALLCAEACVFVALSLFPKSAAWTSRLSFSDFYHFGAWGSILWTAAIVLSSVAILGREFHLGGVVAGCSFFYTCAWLSPLLNGTREPVELLLFVCAPVYFLGGLLLHWFSRLEHRVSYDQLLQVYNRQFADSIIEEQAPVDTAPPFGVAMIDLDHFKKINDRYGHQTGDALLYWVAQTIQREVVPGGIVCRYGGEEIAIFFPRMHTDRIVPIMERVRRSVERMRIPACSRSVSVTVSCGVAHRRRASQSISDVIARADRALYKAKKEGRNQVRTIRSGRATVSQP